MMNLDIESFSPTGSAVLLREIPDAPRRFTALAAGLFTILQAAPHMDADGVRYVSGVPDENLMRGVLYVRNVFIVDGRQFPQPQVGDVIALTIGPNAVAGFEVRAVGSCQPTAQRSKYVLASDELILEFRPDLGSLSEERANVENASALPNLPQPRAT